MPTGFFARLLFDHDRAHWEWTFKQARYADAVNCYENLVRCHRFPRVITKEHDDLCGEFEARPADVQAV